MSNNRPSGTVRKKIQMPYVLIVDKDREYGRTIATVLAELSMCAKHTNTIDEFLDLNCRVRVDLVALEIDVTDRVSRSNLKLARTHFGEGPGTRIVAVTAFPPGGFSNILEQGGADSCVPRYSDATMMAEVLACEIRAQFR